MYFATRPLLSLVILAAIVVCVGACSESAPTDPPGPSNTPRVGSTYRFHRYQADTSGTPLPGSEDTADTRLVSASAQLEGQTAVHVFVQNTDTVARLRYESSGDVLYYPSWARALRSGWLALPVVSKGTQQKTLRDTMVSLGGGEMGRNHVTLSIAYESSDQISLGSDTMQTHRIRMQVIEINPLSTELNLIDTTTHTVWYAPRLGYFARQESARVQQQPFTTIDFPTDVRVLTAYEIK